MFLGDYDFQQHLTNLALMSSEVGFAPNCIPKSHDIKTILQIKKWSFRDIINLKV